MPQWEYNFVPWSDLTAAASRSPLHQAEALLNDLGKEGWELVAPVEAEGGLILIFKRQK